MFEFPMSTGSSFVFPGQIKMAIAVIVTLGATAISNGGSDDSDFKNETIFGPALVSKWCRPDYPIDLVREHREGIVVVRLGVDASGTIQQGKVISTFDSRASEPALAAVRRWKFRPALFANRPAACSVDIPVFFLLKNLREKRLPLIPSLAETPAFSPVTEADAVERSDPMYPRELVARFPGAQISVDLEIDPQGRVIAAMVLDAPDPAFIPVTLSAVRSWRFSPAKEGDLAVPCFHSSVIVVESAPGSLVTPLPLQRMDKEIPTLRT